MRFRVLSRPRLWLVPFAALALTWACSRHQEGARVACGQQTLPPLVTSDAIGTLDLHQAVAELRRACPSARDTVFLGTESRNPAIVVPFGSVTAIGMQPGYAYTDSLVWSVPADLWHVSGQLANLPLGLTLGSSWPQFRTRYGRGIAHHEDRSVVVVFCRYPRLWFVLAGYPDFEGGFTDDLSVLPDTVRVESIWVQAGSFVKTRWGAGTSHAASC